MTFKAIAIIGFGEAGPVFAEGFVKTGATSARAFDIAYDGGSRARFDAKAAPIGVAMCETRTEAVEGAELIISTVTADQTEAAAAQVAPFIKPGQIYLDLNSASPQQKKGGAERIHAHGGLYVEGVAMDTIPLKGFRVPLLLAGPHAAAIAPRLVAHGMVAEAVGTEFGAACSIKLIRSVIIKGLEALFAEAMTAGAKLGVEERIVDTLYETFPGLDWRPVIGYHLSRLAIHGKRRAAELRESALTIESLWVAPMMATAIAERQQWGVDIGLREAFHQAGDEPTIADFTAALKAVGA